jgi:hypothetical protein
MPDHSPLRTDTQALHIARRRDGIRAVLMNGSRVNPKRVTLLYCRIAALALRQNNLTLDKPYQTRYT